MREEKGLVERQEEGLGSGRGGGGSGFQEERGGVCGDMDMCMVQNESEHLSPATYRRDIASDVAGASLATVQFFSHTLSHTLECRQRPKMFSF